MGVIASVTDRHRRQGSSTPPIVRPRLLNLASKLIDHRAYIVTAQAGFGKSTLLAQLVDAAGMAGSVVKVQTSHRDDAALLCSALIHAVTPSRPGFGSHAQAAMKAGLDVRRLAAALAADFGETTEPLLIALDDVHLLNPTESHVAAPPGLMLLESLLRKPDLRDVHFVLAGRRAPQIQLARLVAEKRLPIGLGDADLAFTTDEIREYLEQTSGAAVMLSTARQVRDATKGWPIALALCRDSGNWPRGPRLDVEMVFDYLDHEVMPALPTPLHEFVVDASALTAITPELCSYAIGRDDGDTCLRTLQRRNLFVQRLPGKDAAYQLHDLFRDFLRERYLEAPRRREIESRAAQFWMVNSRWLEALPYIEAAYDWDALVNLVEQHGRTLVTQGFGATVRHALDVVADHRALSDRSLLLHAETLIRASEPAAAMVILSCLHPLDDWGKSELAILRARAARVLGNNDECVAASEVELASGHPSTAQEAQLHRYAALGQQALGRFAEAEAHDLKALSRFEADGNLAEAAFTRCTLGLTYFYQGVDYLKAERFFRQSVRMVRRIHRVDMLAMVLNNFASLLIVTARNREAMEVLQEARSVVEETGDLFWQAEIAHSAGEALRALGDAAGALVAFEESTRAAQDAGLALREQSSCLWRAILHVEVGEEDAATQLVDHARDGLLPKLQPLALLVDLRRAWVAGPDADAVRLAHRVIQAARDTNQERYARFGRLFLAGLLARQGGAGSEFTSIIDALGGDKSQALDAFCNWRDVGDAVLEGLRRQVGNLSHYRMWRSLVDQLQVERTYAPAIDIAQKPQQISIYTLSPTVIVHVDGRAVTGWRRRGALEALLYLVHHGSGGEEMASHLIEDPLASDPQHEPTIEGRQVNKRFHDLLQSLRTTLGRDAVQQVGNDWPRRYRLHPDIDVVYDVAQFLAMASSILESRPSEDQVKTIEAALSFRRAPYAPADHKSGMHLWTLGVRESVENTYHQLLQRRRGLADVFGEPTEEFDRRIKAHQENSVLLGLKLAESR